MKLESEIKDLFFAVKIDQTLLSQPLKFNKHLMHYKDVSKWAVEVIVVVKAVFFFFF